jgi:site-specific DNA-methyltransferase (adenine-specific)
MKAYRKTDNYTLYLADAWEVLDSLPENSIDAVVTDPPYEIGFMNKGWDNTGVAFDRTTWEKVLRVLKPGGHILAFNHSRTFHRMAVAIEDAGFEIRDTIMWLYGSGFPKSHDISKAIDRQAGVEREVLGYVEPFGRENRSGKGGDWHDTGNGGLKEKEITAPATEEAKQWEGWGTALKPAYEPILLARKPIPTTVADNVLTHGVGGLNIDECRVGTEEIKTQGGQKFPNLYGDYNVAEDTYHNGRFPANIIHDGSEEVVEGFPDNVKGKAGMTKLSSFNFDVSSENLGQKLSSQVGLGDEGSASRFFYTSKASKKDRDDGLLGFEKQTKAENLLQRKEGSDGATWNGKYETGNAYAGAGAPKRNIHPTVKPTDLMQYLIRLIAPKGATVLDIFMGSGSTGKAAMIENVERDANYHFIGIDRTEEYMPIAEARIEFGLHYLAEKPKADGVVHTDQIDLFSLL